MNKTMWWLGSQPASLRVEHAQPRLHFLGGSLDKDRETSVSASERKGGRAGISPLSLFSSVALLSLPLVPLGCQGDERPCRPCQSSPRPRPLAAGGR